MQVVGRGKEIEDHLLGIHCRLGNQTVLHMETVRHSFSHVESDWGAQCLGALGKLDPVIAKCIFWAV